MNHNYSTPDVLRINESEIRKETHILRINIEKILNAEGIRFCRIDERPKSIAEVIRKKDYLEKQFSRDLTFSEYTYDLRGIRIITENTEDCYKVLEILTANRGIELLNDYVKNPWHCGYRSIHVTTHFDGLRVQLQIRSNEMHKQAEYLKEKFGDGYWRAPDFKRRSPTCAS